MDVEHARWEELTAAEDRALAMLDAIEREGLIAPGRSEIEVNRAIAELAERDFGITRNWHKRIVRAGANTICVFSDNPADRAIEGDDIVYLDLGPVFEEWEADVGRSYAVGDDPARHALVASLPEVFEQVRAHALADPDITGAALYDFAVLASEERGYIFGGFIAGHIVGEFPHAHLPDTRDSQRIAPANAGRLSDPDGLGRKRFWIIEVHLLAPDRSYGGFYERLLRHV
ncbi:M24 family metallopeptidase [Sphingomonas daechungensis]|uniref:M24 family metallopeptidase n=1 Tax=Sphingomonas daechungensis TaxID=1176646 RepID=UPI003782DE55